MSGSRTGAGGWGSVSGGKGIGPGFGFSGSDGSCGVTGGGSIRVSIYVPNASLTRLKKTRILLRPEDVSTHSYAGWWNVSLSLSRVEQSLNDQESRHDSWLGKLKSSGEHFSAFEVDIREHR